MKTKKEITDYFKFKIKNISYDIAYYRYKNEVIAKENNLKKYLLIKEIALEIGISQDLINSAFETGLKQLDNDIRL